MNGEAVVETSEPPKTQKQLEKEAKKKEKDAKFKEKQEKLAAAAKEPVAPQKESDNKKEKQAVKDCVKYTSNTPVGEKKGMKL